MKEADSFDSIDSYIDSCPKDVQPLLDIIRRTIRESAPDAVETISYQMPAFKQNGILVYFAAFKKHIGFFPTGSGVANFIDELTEYKTSKGTIQLPFDKPLPLDLISRIVKFRVQENMEKQKSKKNSKKKNDEQ